MGSVDFVPKNLSSKLSNVVLTDVSDAAALVAEVAAAVCELDAAVADALALAE